MRSFIIRPFGTKTSQSGFKINFDTVETDLIMPALKAAGLEGGTTIEIIEQGNIREGMFERLLTADFIVADITIHNANVFYELGIRHALRHRCTFLLRGTGARGELANDEVPFDLKTDRYLTYEISDPAATLEQLTDSIKATLRSEGADSPVFQMLPAMVPQDPEKFIAVPREFGEIVIRRRIENRIADLSLMALEIKQFQPNWSKVGLRQVAEALFECKAFEASAEVWEDVRRFDPEDMRANLRLGTCYQKLDQLAQSDLALDRLDKLSGLSPDDLAELRSLKASNAKTIWISDWREKESIAELHEAALSSPSLAAAAQHYHRGYRHDMNHYYSGFNALALFAIRRELAKARPDDWNNLHATDDEAGQALKELDNTCNTLETAVDMAIRASLERGGDKPDQWILIAAADLALLTNTRPQFVAKEYRDALAQANRQNCDSVLRQIQIYTRLGLFGEVATTAEQVVDSLFPEDTIVRQTERFLVFTGHRADGADRTTARFPNTEPVIAKAKAMILAAVKKELDRSDAPLVGVAGGASGGDILFHEVCDELEIPTWLLLAVPEDRYRKASVSDGGAGWIRKFNSLCGDRKAKDRLLVLQQDKELPSWLADHKDYNVWQRNNLWTMSFGLGNGSANTSLIALWNQQEGDGFGGTRDMIELADQHGVPIEILPANDLLDTADAD